MIEIERLSMRLPRGFEHRATSIARMVGEGLATKHLEQDQVLDTVSIRPQRIPLNTSDREIASLIIEEIMAVTEGRNM